MSNVLKTAVSTAAAALVSVAHATTMSLVRHSFELGNGDSMLVGRFELVKK
jgi:hypothetical protein